jgi:hypothetical protein
VCLSNTKKPGSPPSISRYYFTIKQCTKLFRFYLPFSRGGTKGTDGTRFPIIPSKQSKYIICYYTIILYLLFLFFLVPFVPLVPISIYKYNTLSLHYKYKGMDAKKKKNKTAQREQGVEQGGTTFIY